MITYQTLGSADGTPLVFIHGLGAGKKQISSALTNLPDDPDFRALAGRNPPVAASIAPLFDSPDIAVLEKMWSDSPFDSLDSLKKITAPSLVLSSPRDDLHPQEVADAISEVLPNVQSAILPARYHEPEQYHLELNKQISQFL